MKKWIKLKIKKILAINLALSMIIPCVAFAENGSDPITAEQITDGIKINFDFSENDGYVSYVMLYPNQSISNLIGTVVDDTGVIIDADQVQLDKNGDFEKTINISKTGPFGIYKLKAEHNGEIYSIDVNYRRNSGEYGELFRKEINTTDNIIETLIKYVDLLGVDELTIDNLTKEAKSYITEETKKYLPLNSEEEQDVYLGDFANILDFAKILEKVNQADDVDKLSEALKDNMELFNILFIENGEPVRKYVEKVMTALPIDNAEIFDTLNKDFILETLNNASWGAYYKYIKQYSQIGIEDIDKEIKDVTNKDDLYKILAGKAPFSSLSDFKDKFYKAKTEAKNKKDSDNNKSGGGFSGGGGGGSSKPPAISINPSTNNTGNNTENNKTDDEFVFDDLDNVKWAYESIKELKKIGAISGVSETKFDPMRQVKREEFVKMMLNALGYTVEAGMTEFNDVVKDSWYVNYIFTANKSKIVNGVDEVHFGVGNSITREDAAVMINRAVGYKGWIFDLTKGNGEIADLADVADYAQDSVISMFKAGVLNGDESGHFNPKNSLTRAEAAKIIYGATKALVQ